MDANIEKLVALLKTDKDGDKLANLLNELIVDDRKKNVLLVRLNEIRKEMSTLNSDTRLSKSEQTLRSIVLDAKKPLTVQEISESVSTDFKSLKHISHASTLLNSLISKGVLGKFKLGYSYYYTTPKEAVMEQLKRREETPEECSPGEIADETGIPLAVVLDAIEELHG